MRRVAGGRWSVVSRDLAACFLLTAYCLLPSCSLPNLGEPDCEAARDSVREFYSFHLANDMTFSAENLEKRKQFLVPEFYERLKSEPQQGDPFTQTADFPKAFRVGECKVEEAGKRVRFELVLFWKDDVRSEQRTIIVNAENRDGRWLIRDITK